MKRPLILLSAAAGCVAAGGWLISVTWHVSLGHGLYCALGTASTVGCDTAPHTAAGQLAAVLVMVTAIPVLAACFALVTSLHVHRRVSERLAQAEQKVADEADGRHVAMQRHVERLLAGHCADIKQHVSAAADRPASGGPGGNPGEAGLTADRPVVPPPAAKRARKPAGGA